MDTRLQTMTRKQTNMSPESKFNFSPVKKSQNEEIQLKEKTSSFTTQLKEQTKKINSKSLVTRANSKISTFIEIIE